MGFGRRWRGWVMECISTCSMSVLVNGSPFKPFKMERGLRQGDPLSPFLFVLAVDVLHRMIGEAVRNSRISPLLVGRDHIELLHLQFADDTVLFCPPEEETIKNYKRLLRVLGCKEATLPVKYLGISLGANLKLNYPCGGPWRDICQLQFTTQELRQKMINGLSMEVGDGRDTRFWEDVWLLGGLLKDRFPRLYSVSNQVMQADMVPEEITSYSFTSTIWKGLVPPRVEVFVWFALTGRISTKERLSRLGVWCVWLLYAGRLWSCAGSLKEHFLSWTEVSARKAERKAWMVSFCAIIWNLWLERNRRLFQNKGKGVEEIINMYSLNYNEWLGANPFGC
ncbi:uncharacterized protein LOC107645423 [Arachis ipaensis]|uniref:uncharacterized protein LOC107645423 n=1 Tax=Arachis ipaensis TaxID=130454 RepID=UPI0007AF2AD4|nr:uncharacterized protein LOC107645423 [Arachis ipaensis]